MGRADQPVLLPERQIEASVPASQPLWRGLTGVVVMGFGLRLGVALWSEETLHPDEVFQYLEQAHRLVFGYGIVPWEYIHGIRSWLLPMLLALPLWMTHRLGINDPHLYIPIIQILACWVSLSAIFCTYWIGRQLFTESVGRIASVLTAVWWEMVFWGHKATPEILGMYLLLGALACSVSRPNRWVALLFGLCGAGAVALRLQYAPAVAILATLIAIYGWRRWWAPSHLTAAAMGLLAVALGVGWLDSFTWGSWWISYANNYLYNRVYGVSSLFGEDPAYFYLLQLGKNSAGLFWVAIAAALIFKARQTWLLLALIASLVVPHTLISHKEYRFITAVVPLCLMLVAVVVRDLWQPEKGVTTGSFWRQPLAVSMSLLPLVGIGSLFAFAERDPGLQAYLYLNNRPGVTSVLNLTDEWFNTGGYYYLHRDVPIHYAEDVAEMPPEDWSYYFSHLIRTGDLEEVPGFHLETQIGDLGLYVATTAPTEPLTDPHRIPSQGGVEGVYTPRVSPRF